MLPVGTGRDQSQPAPAIQRLLAELPIGAIDANLGPVSHRKRPERGSGPQTFCVGHRRDASVAVASLVCGSLGGSDKAGLRDTACDCTRCSTQMYRQRPQANQAFAGLGFCPAWLRGERSFALPAVAVRVSIDACGGNKPDRMDPFPALPNTPGLPLHDAPPRECIVSFTARATGASNTQARRTVAGVCATTLSTIYPGHARSGRKIRRIRPCAPVPPLLLPQASRFRSWR